ncbi:MAG: MFS transporter [Rhodospirillales bacterium]|nr:MFS transporter [Rhodospirillales bacterium]MBO6786050.1 MFS transporter [Rhodospirillales bacterium]
MTETERKAASNEQPYGWIIVFVGLASLALGFGANVTVSVLIEPLEKEFGWLRADISMAYTMAAAGAATGGLLWGSLSDRFGAKRIALFGATTLGVSLMLVSHQSDLTAIYTIYAAIGGLGFACLFTPLLALGSNWFDRRRGLALGLITAGGALGQGIVPFVLRTLMEHMDWREAMFLLGGGYLLILLPLLMLLRPAPGTAAQAVPMARPAQQWHIPARISLPWLASAGVFCCICMAVPIMHLVPLGNAVSTTPGGGTQLLMTVMICGVAGRIMFGTIADRIGGLRAYMIGSLVQTSIVFWFTQTELMPALFTLAVLFGFGFSGVMTCLIIATREAAPPKSAGLSVAIVTAAGWAGMGIGGYLGGYFYDLTGDYVTSYGVAVLAGVVNLAIASSLYTYRQRGFATAALA